MGTNYTLRTFVFSLNKANKKNPIPSPPGTGPVNPKAKTRKSYLRDRSDESAEDGYLKIYMEIINCFIASVQYLYYIKYL